MSEGIYSIEILAEFFGLSIRKIYNVMSELNMKAVEKEYRLSYKKPKGLYSEQQKQRIENYLNSKMKAKAVKEKVELLYIETVYIYRESRMNNPDSIL